MADTVRRTVEDIPPPVPRAARPAVWVTPLGLVPRRRLLQLACFLLGGAVLVLVAVFVSWAPLLWAAVVMFVVCAVVWVVPQLRHGHQLPVGVVLLVGGVLALGAAAALLAEWQIHSGGGLKITAAAAAVAALGWFIEAWRRWRPDPDDPRRSARLLAGTGVLLLLLTATAVAVTAWRLPGQKGAGYVVSLFVIGAGVLAAAPLGLNLASEGALLRLRSAPRRAHRLVALAGAVCLGGVALLIGLRSDAWLAVALGVLALLVLMFAVASDSHADVALVLILLAMLGAAPPQRDLPPRLTPGESPGAVLVLGDSYTSGEGAKEYFAGTNSAGGNQCRRAPTAWAPRLAETGEPFQKVTFLACSGARSYNVVSRDDDPAARGQHGEPTQLDQLRAWPQFRPDLVVVGLGGNDAGFATIGETCLAPGDCSTQGELFVRNLPRVRAALVATLRSVTQSPALQGVPGVVVPYPQPIADRSTCGDTPLTDRERAFIRDFVSRLNQALRAAAVEVGFAYAAPVEQALERDHLQLCDPAGAAGINVIDLESVDGLPRQRFNPLNWLHNSLHPNARGHAAVASAFQAWASANSAPEPVAEQQVLPGVADDPDPPCSISGNSDEPSCQSITRSWILGQLGGLWPWALVALLACLGAWMTAVGVLGRPHPDQAAS
jgi:hypothetical protein